MIKYFILLIAFFSPFQTHISIKVYEDDNSWKIPIKLDDRTLLDQVKLTDIGQFGRYRKARPGVPGHLHTGIDIKRPTSNYVNEPVFAAGPGKVISMRDDGPYAVIIIEHELSNGTKVWTAYEHVAGIIVKSGDQVNSQTQIARYMSKKELDKHGWQFDHFHFEVLKKEPRKEAPTNKLPMRYYSTYNLDCFTEQDLKNYYFHPLEFLQQKF